MSNVPILCLDFDGVLHSYDSGWKGPIVITDPPVPGALEFVRNALASFEVHIFSSRSHHPGGIFAMKEWLRVHSESHFGCECPWLSLIRWPESKPPALVTIDDRAICFTGVWPEIEELKAFKPWNKK